MHDAQRPLLQRGSGSLISSLLTFHHIQSPVCHCWPYKVAKWHEGKRFCWLLSSKASPFLALPWLNASRKQKLWSLVVLRFGCHKYPWADILGTMWIARQRNKPQTPSYDFQSCKLLPVTLPSLPAYCGQDLQCLVIGISPSPAKGLVSLACLLGSSVS